MDLETLKLRISRCEALPLLSEVAVSVLKLAQDPSSSTRAYEQVIEKDPALVAKILRVACSAQYGIGEVSSLSRAITIVGISQIKSIAVAVAYYQAAQAGVKSKHFDFVQCWQHSFATATACRIFAKLALPKYTDELYLAGLLHEAGMFAMDKFCPETLDRTILSAEASYEPLHVAQKRLLGYDHTAVASNLAHRWSLLPFIEEVISGHLVEDYESPNPKARAILVAANFMAFDAGFKSHSLLPDRGFTPEISETIGIPIEQFPAIGEVLKVEVARVQAALQIRPRQAAA